MGCTCFEPEPTAHGLSLFHFGMLWSLHRPLGQITRLYSSAPPPPPDMKLLDFPYYGAGVREKAGRITALEVRVGQKVDWLRMCCQGERDEVTYVAVAMELAAFFPLEFQ